MYHRLKEYYWIDHESCSKTLLVWLFNSNHFQSKPLLNLPLKPLVLLCFIFQQTLLFFDEVIVITLMMLYFFFQYNHFSTLNVTLLQNGFNTNKGTRCDCITNINCIYTDKR